MKILVVRQRSRNLPKWTTVKCTASNLAGLLAELLSAYNHQITALLAQHPPNIAADVPLSAELPPNKNIAPELMEENFTRPSNKVSRGNVPTGSDWWTVEETSSRSKLISRKILEMIDKISKSPLKSPLDGDQQHPEKRHDVVAGILSFGATPKFEELSDKIWQVRCKNMIDLKKFDIDGKSESEDLATYRSFASAGKTKADYFKLCKVSTPAVEKSKLKTAFKALDCFGISQKSTSNKFRNLLTQIEKEVTSELERVFVPHEERNLRFVFDGPRRTWLSEQVKLFCGKFREPKSDWSTATSPATLPEEAVKQWLRSRVAAVKLREWLDAFFKKVEDCLPKETDSDGALRLRTGASWDVAENLIRMDTPAGWACFKILFNCDQDSTAHLALCRKSKERTDNFSLLVTRELIANKKLPFIKSRSKGPTTGVIVHARIDPEAVDVERSLSPLRMTDYGVNKMLNSLEGAKLTERAARDLEDYSFDRDDKDEDPFKKHRKTLNTYMNAGLFGSSARTREGLWSLHHFEAAGYTYNYGNFPKAVI